MAVVLGVFLLFLGLTGHSSATYCICKDGTSDSVLQKDIDYACGNGASCSPIKDKGACFNPNTVKDHCNYAVNSYFQNKGQAVGSCDFGGTAITTQTLTSQSSSCVYPTSASGGTTPSTGGTTPSTGGTTNSTGLITPTTGSNSFGPTSNNGFGDNSRAAKATLSLHQISLLFFGLFALTLFLSGQAFS